MKEKPQIFTSFFIHVQLFHGNAKSNKLSFKYVMWHSSTANSRLSWACLDHLQEFHLWRQKAISIIKLSFFFAGKSSKCSQIFFYKYYAKNGGRRENEHSRLSIIAYLLIIHWLSGYTRIVAAARKMMVKFYHPI